MLRTTRKISLVSHPDVICLCIFIGLYLCVHLLTDLSSLRMEVGELQLSQRYVVLMLEIMITCHAQPQQLGNLEFLPGTYLLLLVSTIEMSALMMRGNSRSKNTHQARMRQREFPLWL